MTERHTVDSITSDELDQLYDERDAARDRIDFNERDTLPRLRRRIEADADTIGRWRGRAESAELRANTAEARVTELEKQLENQAATDQVASRASQVITAMGADIRVARAERDRYWKAWQSARHRAALYLKSNQNLAASLDNQHGAYLQLASVSVLPGDLRTCCDARIGHYPGCPANQPSATA